MVKTYVSTQSRHPPPIMSDSTNQSFNFHGCNFLCDYFLSSKDENSFHTHSNGISFSENCAPRLESLGVWACVCLYVYSCCRFMCVCLSVCVWHQLVLRSICLSICSLCLQALQHIQGLLRLKLFSLFTVEVCIWHINLTLTTFIGWWFTVYCTLRIL